MRFDFLGQFVFGLERPTASARGYQPALTVARLVLERPSPLRREDLADLLWPDDRPPRWEGPARQVVSRARALLVSTGAPPGCVTSRAGYVEFHVAGEVEVDVELALADTAAAERSLRERDWERADDLAGRALDRLRLPFFPTSNATWTKRWRDRVRGQRLRALHVGADAARSSCDQRRLARQFLHGRMQGVKQGGIASANRKKNGHAEGDAECG